MGRSRSWVGGSVFGEGSAVAAAARRRERRRGADIARKKREQARAFFFNPTPIIRPAGCASELLGPGCEVTDCTPSAPRSTCVVYCNTASCLLAPSRGGVLKLRGNPVHGANPRRPVFTLRPLPCERAPPQREAARDCEERRCAATSVQSGGCRGAASATRSMRRTLQRGPSRSVGLASLIHERG